MTYYFTTTNQYLKENVVKYISERIPGFGILGPIEIIYLRVDSSSCYLSNFAMAVPNSKLLSISEFMSMIDLHLERLRKHYE